MQLPIYRQPETFSPLNDPPRIRWDTYCGGSLEFDLIVMQAGIGSIYCSPSRVSFTPSNDEEQEIPTACNGTEPSRWLYTLGVGLPCLRGLGRSAMNLTPRAPSDVGGSLSVV